MTLLPTNRQDGEGYASVDDLLTCVDLAEADVRVPLWGKGGQPLLLRARALSLAEENAAHHAARMALVRTAQQAKLPPPGPDDEDWGTLVLETIQRGVVAPHLTPAQAQQLRDKNPHALEQLYAFIVSLRAFTPAALDALVQALAGTPPDDDAGPADADAMEPRGAALGTDDRLSA